MPDFVTLVGDVKCPHCDRVVDTSIDIQWGKVPKAAMRIHDQVKWLEVDGTVVSPFTLLEGQTCWNCGDPAKTTVYVFDGNRYAVDDAHTKSCPACGKDIAGVMAVIVANVLTEIKACTTVEMRSLFGSKLGKADIIVVERDGSFTVRDDWIDHTVTYVEAPR